MKKRGIFNVNEERLKEFMANGTDAERNLTSGEDTRVPKKFSQP